jgi:predicted small integral membrane protein
LNDYWVFISDTPFLSTETLSDILARSGTWKSHQSTAPNPSSTISLAGVRGRYVRVQLSGSDYLHLAEVQVVGTIP